MLAEDLQAVKERCDQISQNKRWVDVMVGNYYDQNPSTPTNIVEVNRIRKEVVGQPEYIRKFAIEQLRSEGVLLSEC